MSFEAVTNMSFRQGAQYVLPHGLHALIARCSFPLGNWPGSQQIMHVISGIGGGGGGGGGGSDWSGGTTWRGATGVTGAGAGDAGIVSRSR